MDAGPGGAGDPLLTGAMYRALQCSFCKVPFCEHHCHREMTESDLQGLS